jgi:hypothetical protein
LSNRRKHTDLKPKKPKKTESCICIHAERYHVLPNSLRRLLVVRKIIPREEAVEECVRGGKIASSGM